MMIQEKIETIAISADMIKAAEGVMIQIAEPPKIDDKIINDIAANPRWTARVGFDDTARLIPKDQCEHVLKILDKNNGIDLFTAKAFVVALISRYSPSQQASLRNAIGEGKLLMAAMADHFIKYPANVCQAAISTIERQSPDFIPSSGRVAEALKETNAEIKQEGIERVRWIASTHLKEHERRDAAIRKDPSNVRVFQKPSERKKNAGAHK